MRGWITTKLWVWAAVFGIFEFAIGFAVGRLT